MGPITMPLADIVNTYKHHAVSKPCRSKCVISADGVGANRADVVEGASADGICADPSASLVQMELVLTELV